MRIEEPKPELSSADASSAPSHIDKDKLSVISEELGEVDGTVKSEISMNTRKK